MKKSNLKIIIPKWYKDPTIIVRIIKNENIPKWYRIKKK